ncbi:hypothetical protein GAYE_SCF20G4107 [Galdieria yellowstonensis]|uniref:Lipid desaturase domain-containing protein n=1 Tax=Galdieria yellowstonensis TaxID=3028027 RepID=A0AAV9IFS2_9RHOD|nr:hypothetical protein GAYE_SCF20G4107 [Galdieria yellowstonensis]
MLCLFQLPCSASTPIYSYKWHILFRCKWVPFLRTSTFHAPRNLCSTPQYPMKLKMIDSSGTKSAKGKKSLQPTFTVQGDTLQVYWHQYVVVITSICSFAALFVRNIQATIISISNHEYESFLVSFAFASQVIAIHAAYLFMGYLVADFASGLYHWFLDNYGNENTPIIGKQCVAFQGHHQHPWTITWRPFCNLVGTSCLLSIPFLMVLLTIPLPSSLQTFLTSFGFFVVFAQQTHQWAHLSKPPRWIEMLQQKNILLSTKQHGQHHKPPFNKKYCIVSGICNDFLDNIQFYDKLERWVYILWRWIPRHRMEADKAE